MEITAKLVKELRDKTNSGFMDCKMALTEAQGDVQKAVELLRKKGHAVAAKKAGRATKEGVVGSYIHMGGKIGVLVEINCETDFVAKNEHFQALVKDIAMHIAAANPLYISRDSVCSEVIEKEKEIFKAQIKNKPDNIIEKIVEGKVNRYFKEICLLEQPYVKNPDTSVDELIKSKIHELGENIGVKRFVRYHTADE